ncbi:MAG: response regulator transcription factor [Acidobacteria bacterium]|nr:response regulator transcription factor [Acidobacteriota bacterium]
MNEKIEILIADDHPIVRQGLRTSIERETDFEIVAEAGDGDAALQSIRSLRPAVCVLDIDMPGKDGFAVVRELQKLGVATRVIFLTVHREADLLDEAIALGVRGYVLKDSALAEIVLSIRAALKGDFFMSAAMASYLVGRRRKTPPRADLALLTETEKKVLKLLAGYKTSKEIANELFISPRTVETHRKNIAAKLDLHGSHALMKFALAHEAEL